MARTHLHRAGFEQWGLSEGCSGCRYLRTGQGRQEAHSEACRRRIEGLLRGDTAGSTRLAANDERINRAMADAVERHATRDPGVRSILKRASAVSHPESEPQKKVALDTEQEPTPRPPVSHGGSSASGTRHNTTLSTDQSTHTSDATRETRGEPAQGVTQASNGNNTGCDVVMEGDSVGESSLEHSNPSGTAEGGSRQRENHVKFGTSNRLSLSSTSRGGFWGRTPQEHAVAVTTQEAPDAIDMTHCDFSAKTARDEMRHIIGGSEPHVIIVSDNDQNRGCKKRDKDHLELLCELYEAQIARGRYFVHELTSEVNSRMEVRYEDHGHAGNKNDNGGSMHVRSGRVRQGRTRVGQR